MPEFYDLNLVMPRATKTTRNSAVPPSMLPALVAMACSGYSVVAISRVVYGYPSRETDQCDFDPSNWADAVAAKCAESAMLGHCLEARALTILRRLTIVAESKEDVTVSLNEEVTCTYDILAVSISVHSKMMLARLPYILFLKLKLSCFTLTYRFNRRAKRRGSSLVRVLKCTSSWLTYRRNYPTLFTRTRCAFVEPKIRTRIM